MSERRSLFPSKQQLHLSPDQQQDSFLCLDDAFRRVVRYLCERFSLSTVDLHGHMRFYRGGIPSHVSPLNHQLHVMDFICDDVEMELFDTIHRHSRSTPPHSVASPSPTTPTTSPNLTGKHSKRGRPASAAVAPVQRRGGTKEGQRTKKRRRNKDAAEKGRMYLSANSYTDAVRALCELVGDVRRTVCRKLITSRLQQHCERGHTNLENLFAPLDSLINSLRGGANSGGSNHQEYSLVILSPCPVEAAKVAEEEAITCVYGQLWSKSVKNNVFPNQFNQQCDVEGMKTLLDIISERNLPFVCCDTDVCTLGHLRPHSNKSFFDGCANEQRSHWLSQMSAWYESAKGGCKTVAKFDPLVLWCLLNDAALAKRSYQWNVLEMSAVEIKERFDDEGARLYYGKHPQLFRLMPLKNANGANHRRCDLWELSPEQWYSAWVDILNTVGYPKRSQRVALQTAKCHHNQQR